MLKLKGRLLFLLAGIATATLFVPGAKAQQPPSNHSILSERGVLLAAYTEKSKELDAVYGVCGLAINVRMRGAVTTA
jgi:hypothetical protein